MLEGKAEPDYYEVGELPDEAFRYWSFADAFGWTPTQCDEMGAAQADWVLAVHNLVKKVRDGGSTERSDSGDS